MTDPAATYLKNLENLLDNDFAASGESLEDKIASLRAELPDELIAELADLVSCASVAGTDDVAGVAFRCGQLTQRLEQFRQDRATDSLLSAQAAGLSPEILAEADLDGVARLIALRDKAMRAVADFTLKALLVITGLLVIGLLLGLI